MAQTKALPCFPSLEGRTAVRQLDKTSKWRVVFYFVDSLQFQSKSHKNDRRFTRRPTRISECFSA